MKNYVPNCGTAKSHRNNQFKSSIDSIIYNWQQRTTDPMVVHLSKLDRPTTFSETNTQETLRLITCGTSIFLLRQHQAIFLNNIYVYQLDRHLSVTVIIILDVHKTLKMLSEDLRCKYIFSLIYDGSGCFPSMAPRPKKMGRRYPLDENLKYRIDLILASFQRDDSSNGSIQVKFSADSH